MLNGLLNYLASGYSSVNVGDTFRYNPSPTGFEEDYRFETILAKNKSFALCTGGLVDRHGRVIEWRGNSDMHMSHFLCSDWQRITLHMPVEEVLRIGNKSKMIKSR